MSIKWTEIKVLEKKDLLDIYINNMIKENQDDYMNGKIDNLTYNKNCLFLDTLKRDKKLYQKINDDDIVIKDKKIYEMENIKKNYDGLIFYLNNKHQTKLVDFNYKTVKKYRYEKNKIS